MVVEVFVNQFPHFQRVLAVTFFYVTFGGGLDAFLMCGCFVTFRRRWGCLQGPSNIAFLTNALESPKPDEARRIFTYFTSIYFGIIIGRCFLTDAVTFQT